MAEAVAAQVLDLAAAVSCCISAAASFSKPDRQSNSAATVGMLVGSVMAIKEARGSGLLYWGSGLFAEAVFLVQRALLGGLLGGVVAWRLHGVVVLQERALQGAWRI